MDVGNDVINCRYLMGARECGIRRRALAEGIKAAGLDALLLVAGVDGRDDLLNTILLNWLLCGSLDPVLVATELDETMIVIAVDGTSTIYTTPGALPLLSHLTGSWGRVDIICLGDEDSADQFVFEEDKINAFRRMVAPLKSLGVVYHDKGDVIRVVEKWPIVQSYAVDEKGSRPFLSMHKKIENVWKSVVLPILSQPDLLDASRMALYDVSMMAFQWESALSAVDRNRLTRPMSEITELILEPLSAFFQYGTMAVPVSTTVNEGAAAPPSCVLAHNAPQSLQMDATHPAGTLRVTRAYPVAVDNNAVKLIDTIATVQRIMNAKYDTTQALVDSLKNSAVPCRAEVSVLPRGATYVAVVLEQFGGLTVGDTFVTFPGVGLTNLTGSIAPRAAVATSTSEAESKALVDASLGKEIDEIHFRDGLKIVTASGVEFEASVTIFEKGFALRSRRLGVVGSLLGSSDVEVRYAPSADIATPLAVQLKGNSGSLAVCGGSAWLVAKPSSFARRLLNDNLRRWKSDGAAVVDSPEPLPAGVDVEALFSTRAKPPVFDNSDENIEASWREQRRYLRNLLPSAFQTTAANSKAEAPAGATRLIVVSSIAGVNATPLVQLLVNSLHKSGRTVKVFDQPAREEIAFSADLFNTVAAEAVRDKTEFLVVECPKFTPLEQLLGFIKQAAPSLVLQGCVCAVTTDLFYRDYERTPPKHVAPYAWSAVSSGCLTHCVLLSRSGTSNLISRIENLVRGAHDGRELRFCYDMSDVTSESFGLLDEKLISGGGILESIPAVAAVKPDVERVTVAVEGDQLLEPAVMDFIGNIRAGVLFPTVAFAHATVAIRGQNQHYSVARNNNAFSTYTDGETTSNVRHEFDFYGTSLDRKALEAAVVKLRKLSEKQRQEQGLLQ